MECGALSCEFVSVLLDSSSGSGDEGGVSIVTVSSGLKQRQYILMRDLSKTLTKILLITGFSLLQGAKFQDFSRISPCF